MRIACILGPDFEDSEFRVPYDRYQKAGHQVTVIGIDKKEVKGKKGKESVKPEKTIDEVAPGEFDALFIPGGGSPDHLRADPRMVSFVQSFEDKPIFAICHGPQILITAHMVEGRTMTAWKTIQGDLDLAGAHVEDQEAVVDRNFVTSRSPDDLDAFVRASLAQMQNTSSHAYA